MIIKYNCNIPITSCAQEDVLAFAKSGCRTCEVALEGYKDAKSARYSYEQAIKRVTKKGTIAGGIKVVLRNGRVYLIKEADK